MKEETRAPCRDYHRNTQLAVTGINSAENTLDDVLRYDGNYDLSKIFTSAVFSQENAENKIKQRQ